MQDRDPQLEAADRNDGPAGSTEGEHDATMTVSGSRVEPADGQLTTQEIAPHQGHTILKPLAEGGLGTVSVARDESLGRSVALKQIRTDRQGDETLRLRFVAEAEITSRLQHPGVVPVYRMDTDDQGQPYYTMRLIEGRTLAEGIAEYHERPSPRVLRDLLQRYVSVCQTMAYAHSRHVIHRDLKPSNVMLGEFGETLVVDWGLAKSLATDGAAVVPSGSDRPSQHNRKEVESSGSTAETMAYSPSDTDDSSSTSDQLTMAGQVIGTASFMSPEQAAGRPVDEATDIYALGAILYKILSGDSPYEGSSVADTLTRLITGPPPRPSEIRTDVPKPLESICLKAMARAASERYRTAGGLAQDIDRWLADEPVSTYSEPITLRVHRWVRRHRTLVAATVALLLTAVIALSIGMVVVGNKQHETEVALDAEARRRKQTREALDTMSDQIIDEWLAKQRELTANHRAFLQKALQYYEEFAADTGFDEDGRAGVAAAHVRIAGIRKSLGESESADAAYRRALDLYAALEAEFPNNSTYRRKRATCLRWIGVMLARGGQHEEAIGRYGEALAVQQQLADELPNDQGLLSELSSTHYSTARAHFQARRFSLAVADFERSLEIDRQLLDADPANTNSQHHVAATLQNLALALKRDGREDDAEAAYLEAIGIEEGLREQFPHDQTYRWQLGVLYNDLGVLYKSQGDRAKAAPYYKDAMLIRKQLVAEFPGSVEYAVMLGGSYLNLGNLLRLEGQPEESLSVYTDGVATLEKLLQQDPSYTMARRFLRNTHEGRAESHHLLGKFAAAVADWDRSIVHNNEEHGTGDPYFAVRLPMRRATALVHLGRVDEAIEIFERVDAQIEGDARLEVGYFGAGVLATASAAVDDAPLKERYACRAVELLKEALDGDYKGTGVTGNYFSEDPDFSPLRDRADYQTLVAAHPEEED